MAPSFLVSVIIPLFNSERYIIQAIESVLSQTYKKIEIIVIDDGSTDNSLNLLQQYKGKIHLYSQKNKGASSARNFGLRKAKGEYIQFLDSDDILEPKKIENQILFLVNEDLDVLVFGSWVRFVSEINEQKGNDQIINKDYPIPYKLLIDMWNGKGMIQPGAWLASKRLLLKAGMWNENLSLNDDGEYYCRVILASQKIVYCKNAVVYYRSELSESLSKRIDYNSLLSQLDSFDCYVSNCLFYLHDNELRNALAFNYANYIYQFHYYNSTLCKRAHKSIIKLGYKDIPITGGFKFKLFARIVGFSNALFIKRFKKMYFK